MTKRKYYACERNKVCNANLSRAVATFKSSRSSYIYVVMSFISKKTDFARISVIITRIEIQLEKKVGCAHFVCDKS